MIKVELIKDSISPLEKRITTFLLTYPRFIHAEMLRHRVLSRSAQSSRAVPTNKLLERVKETPVIPLHWGENQKGMQASTEVSLENRDEAEKLWLECRNEVVKKVEELQKFKIHKQIINRLLEPFCTITEVVTGTDFGNFFNLRVHKDAQPEIREVAIKMLELYESNTPDFLNFGDWHLPFLGEEEKNLKLSDKIKVSFARCARASYVNFYGKKDIQEDCDLHDDLVPKFHISPAEHQAEAKSPYVTFERSEFEINILEKHKYKYFNWKYLDYLRFKDALKAGPYRYYFKNFDGWAAYRTTIINENRLNYNKEDLLKGLK